jgi:hypothetical protein
MLAVFEPVTVACAALLLLFSLYLVALWAFALVRTGSFAFALLLAAALIGLGVSIANVALVYDSYIGIRLLGPSMWKIFYDTFVCIQPIGSLLSAVALTMLVIWITRRGLTNRWPHLEMSSMCLPPHPAVAYLFLVRRYSPLMRMTILSLVITSLAVSTRAADFSRASSFESVVAFVAAAQGFQPASARSDLSNLFTVRDRSPEGPESGTLVTASTIESATELWSNNTHGLVFVTAAPVTEATPSSVGALFLLSHQGGPWHIADVLRFLATGREAKILAELTAFAGGGSDLDAEGKAPVVTVTEYQGGRGYSYQSSASYTLKGSKLKRLDLE